MVLEATPCDNDKESSLLSLRDFEQTLTAFKRHQIHVKYQLNFNEIETQVSHRE